LVMKMIEDLKTPEDIEKGLLSFLGKQVTFFAGKVGNWVTIRGRPIFIRLKGIFKSDVATADVKQASTAFKKLPRNMRVGLGSVHVRGRSFVERAFPEKTVIRVLGKEIFQVSKLKVKSRINFVFPPAPKFIERVRKVADPKNPGKRIDETTFGFTNKQNKFIGLPKDAIEDKTFLGGPGYTTVVEGKRKFIPFFPEGPKQVTTTSTTLTILPGRLQALARLRGGQQPPLPGFGSGLDITDIVNRAGGRSVFPTPDTKLNKGLAFVIERFEDTVGKERGVTRAAERVRRRFVALERVDVPGTRRNAANENFAELFMVFQRKDTKYKAQWAALQKSHPETVKRFFSLMEIFDVVGA